ncbi:hypothetical protein ACJ72_07697, partial [Emergomyces africanus]
IVSHLDWNDEALAASYYQELKDEIKDEIARVEQRSFTLTEMIEIAVRIDNRLYEQQLEKKEQYINSVK